MLRFIQSRASDTRVMAQHGIPAFPVDHESHAVAWAGHNGQHACGVHFGGSARHPLSQKMVGRQIKGFCMLFAICFNTNGVLHSTLKLFRAIMNCVLHTTILELSFASILGSLRCLFVVFFFWGGNSRERSN